MPSVRIKRQRLTVRITEVSLTDVVIDIADDQYEPFNVIQRKIDDIVDVLGCTEAEAQRIVLNHQ